MARFSFFEKYLRQGEQSVRRPIVKRPNFGLFLVAWKILLPWAIATALYATPAPSEPIPVSIWAALTYNNSDLPADNVLALAPSADGALWIGTAGGLARLDKDGRWQTYSKASTKGGLSADNVQALALGADGALWIGTGRGGLAQLDKDGR